MDQALERQKGHEDEATAAFNQVFRALAQNLQAGLPATATETKSKQPSSCKPSVLMDLIVLLKYSVISVKATFITQSLRKTLTNLDLEQPSTHQMWLLIMSKLRQNKIGGVFFRFFTKFKHYLLNNFLLHLVSHGQIYIQKAFQDSWYWAFSFCSSREIEVKTMVTDTNFFFTVINFQFF